MKFLTPPRGTSETNNLDKRTHDFLMYMELKNHYDKLEKEDLKWIVEYLEDRLDYYLGEGKKEIEK